MPGPQKQLPYLSLVLTFIPLIYLIFIVIKFKVDVPFWDQWELVPLLEKYYQGTVGFSDLWAQHNEHRPLFPRLIMLILAKISNWDITYELAVNILLALGILGAIVYQINKSLMTNLLLPIISLMIFSLAQAENWLWGWQIQFFLNIFAVVVGFIILTNPPLTRLSFVLTLILGIIATYSVANGLLFWPIGLLMLLLNCDNQNRRIYITAWLFISVIVFLSYFYTYHQPEQHPSLFFVFYRPLVFISYVLTYLGALLSTFNTEGAFIFGLLGVSIFSLTPWILIKAKKMNLQTLLPLISLGLYAIGTAVITGIGRAGFGALQAKSFRYVAFSSLFWVINVILLYLLGTKQRVFRLLSIISIVAVVFLVGLSSAHGTWFAIKHHNKLSLAKEAILVGEDDEVLKSLYIKDIVKERVEILKKYRLSVFRDGG